MNAVAKTAHPFLDQLLQLAPVRVINENRLLVISAKHDVVQAARQIYPCFARHIVSMC
jgi:hypothetical protein